MDPAPTLQRKLALTAKVQDEVGHGQLIYRVVEDLGKPREACFEDLIAGKTKFHNVFHYPTKTWGDVGVIAWLVDAAAIISQKALLCSYAPYARIMKKICWEESFHILHGRDVVLTMMTGTDEQRSSRKRSTAGGARSCSSTGIRPRPRTTRCTSGGSRARRTRTRASSSSTGTSTRSGSSASPFPTRRSARTRRPASGTTRSPTGTSSSGSSPATARDGAAPRPPARLARRDGLGAPGGPRRRAVIWEVFRQEREGQPFQHGGSLEAPNLEFAEAYAVEFYGRRAESVALWVVPRDSIRRSRSPTSPTSSTATTGAWTATRSRSSSEARVNAQAPPSAAVEAVLAFADDEPRPRLAGFEWTGVAPFLEEDVAFSSIAQGEIGHARALYELVAGVQGGDADALAFDRLPEEYRCAPFVELQLVGDWAATIARHGLYETADAIRVKALMAPTGPSSPGSRRRWTARSTTTACTRACGWTAGGKRAVGDGGRRAWPYALGVLEPGQRASWPSSSGARRSRRSSAGRTPTASRSCTRR